MSLAFRVTDETGEATEAIGRALAAFNAQDVGPTDKQMLAVIAEEGPGLVAGLVGYTAWGWLYIQWLWVDEARRGEGLGAALLERAEAEARRRGCTGAHIDTFNPAARRLYQRQGYQVFGEIAGFFAGRTRSFLQKPL